MATEKRMIDTDVAIERARASDNIVGSRIWETCEVVEFLEDCPIVDAVEVVHGRCVYVRDDELTDHWECSVCGKYIPWEYHRYWNYCPNCGAKMYGVQE